MDNVEFVKAYEHWKLFEAVDVSPERFQRELDSRTQTMRVKHLLRLVEAEEELDTYFVGMVLEGEYDEDIKEAEND